MLALALGFGCNKRIVIAEYPVKQAADAGVLACGEEPEAAETRCVPDCEQRNCGYCSEGDEGCLRACTTTCEARCNPDTPVRYWSAYAYVDPHNIAVAWDEKALSQIFVSAEVQIPTRTTPLVRDFPLFTASGGSIQQHAGVDLLQKLPIMMEARQQVSVTLKVKYLKNQEAMKVARKILAVAEGLAKPLLDNYPAASQVLTAATETIDSVVEDANGQPPNSFSQYIMPERLAERHGEALTMAFLLQLGEDIQPESGDREPKLHQQQLTTCADMPFALCEEVEGKRCYQQNAVGVPYVTLTFRGYEQVYEPMLLLPGGSDSCDLLDAVGVERVRNFLNDNRDLFHPEDVAVVEANLSAAEQQLQAREVIRGGDILAILEFLNFHGSAIPLLSHRPCAPSGWGYSSELPKCSRLVDDGYELMDCAARQWDQMPARHLRLLWEKMNDGRQDCEWGDIQLHPAACESGYLGTLLTKVVASAGYPGVDFSRSLASETLGKLEDGVFKRSVVLYHSYLRLESLRHELLREVDALDEKKVCENINDAAKLLTPYCTTCKERLNDKLKNCKAWDGIRKSTESQFEQQILGDIEGGKQEDPKSLTPPAEPPK